MKIKKKLRDVTPEEYEKYKQKTCTKAAGIQEFEFDVIKLLVFDNNKFKEMELNKNYSLEELGL